MSFLKSSLLQQSLNVGRKEKRLTSIVTVLVKTDEHMINLQVLFCKLQQKGEAAGTKKTRGVNTLR